MVEMLGLKKPFPQIRRARPTKKAVRSWMVNMNRPRAIRTAPATTERRAPKNLSASMPPMNGVAYTSEV